MNHILAKELLRASKALVEQMELMGDPITWADDDRIAFKEARDAVRTAESQSVMYDVCNDYSLDLADPEKLEKEDWTQYRFYERKGGIVYKHIEYDEIHYFESHEGLEGTYPFGR